VIVTALLRLLVLVPLAYVAALFAAAVTVAIALFGGRVDEDTAGMAVGLSIGLTIYGGMISFLPALVALIVAETMRLRSIFFYLAVGGLIGLVSAEIVVALDGLTFAPNLRLICLAAGFVGGAVYWLIAGKLAGLGTGTAEPTSPA
jgi:hypothetical protein